MDRTAWIIISICVALLGLNIYYSEDPKPTTPPTLSSTANSAVSNAAPQQTAVQSPVSTNVAPSGDYATAIQADKDSPITLVETQTVDGKEEPFLTYTFSRIGGAIKSVTLHNDVLDSQNAKDANVVINESQQHGIGQLAFNMSMTQDPSYDSTIYTVTEKTQNSITLGGFDKSRGLFIQKKYTLHPINNESGQVLDGSKYIIRLAISFVNKSANPLDLSNLGVFAGSAYPISTNEQDGYYTYLFYQTDGSLEKESPDYFTDGIFSKAKARILEGPLNNLSYAGVMSQYYATILLPQNNSLGSTIYATRQEFSLPNEDNAVVPGVSLAMGAPNQVILPQMPGQTLTYDIYTGPKVNPYLRDLNSTYSNISDVMDYGWLTILSVPMNWLLHLFHGWFGNWGVAIVCMTIVVRLVIWPLHKKSYLSMKRMSLIQPELTKLREKYPDDPQKVNMEMMKLYQKYGINPVGGCLPMLIQMPIFFAFYWVLQSCAELRGEPFCLWITDLSLPDTVGHIFGLPINVLPLVMAATMVLQMVLTPQTGDKNQRMIMYFMPLIFFAFCYNFASALALYWTVQNIISIGQSALLRRVPLPTLKESKKKKPGFLQRLAEQQRAMMEEQQRQTKNGNMRNITPKK